MFYGSVSSEQIPDPFKTTDKHLFFVSEWKLSGSTGGSRCSHGIKREHLKYFTNVYKMCTKREEKAGRWKPVKMPVPFMAGLYPKIKKTKKPPRCIEECFYIHETCQIPHISAKRFVAHFR